MEQQPENKNLLWRVREVDHLFAAFRRYTKFVLFSKWFLGLLAIALMTSLVAWPLISKSRSGVRISFIGTDAKHATSVAAPVMNHPVYQGVTSNGDQYKITGLRAVQKTSELIVIEQVEGQLVKANGDFTALSANNAEYIKAQDMIELIGDVVINDASGYNFVTPRARIHIATMDVEGDAQVEGTGPQGNLLAIGFKIRDNAKRIIFGGTSRVTVHIEKMRQEP